MADKSLIRSHAGWSSGTLLRRTIMDSIFIYPLTRVHLSLKNRSTRCREFFPRMAPRQNDLPVISGAIQSISNESANEKGRSILSIFVNYIVQFIHLFDIFCKNLIKYYLNDNNLYCLLFILSANIVAFKNNLKRFAIANFR